MLALKPLHVPHVAEDSCLSADTPVTASRGEFRTPAPYNSPSINHTALLSAPVSHTWRHYNNAIINALKCIINDGHGQSNCRFKTARTVHTFEKT